MSTEEDDKMVIIGGIKYEYLYETAPGGEGGALADMDATLARLNQLGKEGWRLICFTGGVYWMMR